MATAITRDDAIILVGEQAASDQPPTLTPEQIGGLVDRSARMDADGNVVGSDDWAETYDLNAATALAWERKAALTATKFDATIDGQTLRREQLYKHCVAEAQRYRNRIVGRARRAAPEDPTVDALVDGLPTA